jgi:hypothetical protein
MAYNTGGMLATTGLNVGQLIGGGFADLGAGIGTGVGGMMTRRRERQGAQNAQQQFQQIVGAYKDDPVGMMREAQKAKLDPDTNIQQMGDMLMEEAQRLTASQKTKEEKGTAQGIQGGLSAITQAAARGIPLADLQEGVRSVINLGGTQPQIMSAYEAGSKIAKGEKPETVSGTPGTQFLKRDPTTGKLVVEAEVPFKPEAAPASKGIKMQERDDGSLTIVDADDGSLISTLPPIENGDEAKRDASLSLIAQTTSFIKDVDELMDPGFFETGLIGQATAGLGGTPAYDREKDLLSIRARLGFDQINEMKRLAKESGASGTGLGQISNIEFMSLQSTIDAIYVGMSAEAQNKALESIKKHLLNVQRLASGIAPADAIEWEKPEYKAVGYHKDPETGNVYYAPDGKNGTVYKLVDGKFVKLGAYLGSTSVE